MKDKARKELLETYRQHIKNNIYCRDFYKFNEQSSYHKNSNLDACYKALLWFDETFLNRECNTCSQLDKCKNRMTIDDVNDMLEFITEIQVKLQTVIIGEI